MATVNLGRIGFVNKGNWVASTAYKLNDVVTYSNKVYACTIAHTSTTTFDTAKWILWVDSSGYALLNGDATKTFKVADAVNTDEALAKGQLLTEIKSIDGAGSGLDADTLDGTELVDLYTREQVAGTIGNINSPLLDLPLQNSLQMKVGTGSVTFSRSTTATYVDRYGVLQTAAIDEPRFEKDGLLIEGGSTNLLSDVNIEQVGITLTTGVASPDGLNNAVLITGDGTSTEHFKGYVINVPNDSLPYTSSVYVKKGNRDTIVVKTFIIGGTTEVTSKAENIFTFSTETLSLGGKVEKLSGGWYRLSFTNTNNSTGNVTSYIRVYTDVGGITTSNDTVYVFGYQLESLPFASSYIPTTDSAVTRGADLCSITAKDNVSTDILSMTLDYQSDVAKPAIINNIIKFDAGGYGFSLKIWDGADYNFLPYYNGTPVGGQTDASTQISIAQIYDGSKLLFYTNGSILNSKVLTQNIFTISDIVISTLMYRFHIKNLKIYDKALSATEVALLGGKV